MNNLTKKDLSFLYLIAEYIILLADQIALLNFTKKRMVQRRISKLSKLNLVNVIPRTFGASIGRPENIISLNENGLKVLKEEKLIDPKIPLERCNVDNSKTIEHELLINWSRIHSQYIRKKLPYLKIDFISSKTPFLPIRSNGLPLISESFSVKNSHINFIPDGVFYINNENQNKSLLFFLEVDRGTESLKSNNSNSNNILSKIKNYRIYFYSGKYKRYQKKWNTLFNGFRLLFLTNSPERSKSISNLVNTEKTNDFIWIADQYDMFKKGLGGKIWARGGRNNAPQQSILGPTLNFEQSIIDQK